MLVTLIRTILIYLVVVFGLRLMGKRQLGELQPSELVVAILVSDIATMPIEDTGLSLLSGVIPILTLVSFDILLSAATLKSKRLRRWVSGTPRLLIRNGVIDQKEMKNLRFSIDDLTEQLRIGGIFDLRDVAFAVVETTGTLSVCPKSGAQPVTPEQLQLKTSPDDTLFPVAVISDGQLLPGGMRFCGVSEHWVREQTASRGYTPEQIFLMTCTPRKEIWLVPKEENP